VLKLAFLGTCQLQRIASGIEQMAAQQKLDAQVVWNTPFFEVGAQDTSVFFNALETADIVYCQYDSNPEGWPPDRLGRYFPVRVVPTLLSYVSRPQLDLFPGTPKAPANFAYVDMRMLELYLAGVPVGAVAKSYQAELLEPDRVAALIERERAKYQRRFAQGLVCLNYAPFYEPAIANDLDSYLSCNHPGNIHLEWLFNEIVRDCGGAVRVSITGGANLLDGWRAPSLHKVGELTYVMNCNEHSMDVAAKIFYYYFDSVARSTLEERFSASPYYQYFRAPLSAHRTETLTGNRGVPMSAISA
jgi:hypothetical protein